MFDAVADGRIKALWVMGTNPAVSLPRADAVREALARLDLLVVSENVASNDTVDARACAPAGRGLGREGRHGHQLGAAHLAPARVPAARPARRRPDWWIVRAGGAAARLRRGLRLSGRRRRSSASTRALSGFENDGERAFDISGARRPEHGRTSTRLRAVPVAAAARASAPTARLFADGRFFTPDGKARFVAIAPPRARGRRLRRRGRSCSTPAACATSGTP